MDETLVAKLRVIPIFAGLDDSAVALLGTVVTELEAPAGHVLTQPGQDGSGMFVLEEGTVTVELAGGATTSLRPGEFFGELAILEAEPDIAVAILPVLARRIAGIETAGLETAG